MDFSCDFRWHPCIFLNKVLNQVISCLSLTKRLLVAGQGCHSALLSLCLCMFASEQFQCCKTPFSQSVTVRDFLSYYLFWGMGFLTVTAYLQISLSRIDSVPSSCPENVAFRRCEDGSVSAPKFSSSFCTFWKQCVCARDNYKERSLGNCEEITKDCLDVDDFHSLRLWQDWPNHSETITLLRVKLTVHHIL